MMANSQSAAATAAKPMASVAGASNNRCRRLTGTEHRMLRSYRYSIPGVMKTAVSSNATSAADTAYSLAESGSSGSCRGGGGALAFGPGKPRTSPEPGQRGLRPSPPSSA